VEELDKILNQHNDKSIEVNEQQIKLEQNFKYEDLAIKLESPTVDKQSNEGKFVELDGDIAFLDEEEGEVKRELKEVERLKKTPKIHVCDYCDQMFDNEPALGRHVTVHKERLVVDLPCNICAKSFSRLTSLKSHLRSHRERTACCEVCGENLSTRKLKGTTSQLASDYDKHIRIHKVMDFSCDCQNVPVLEKGDEYGIEEKHISKRFILKEQHMKRVHLGWHGCDLCITSFETLEKLQKHLGQYHNIKCAQCDYIAKNRSLIQKHINAVHNPIESKCKVCNETFTNTNLLKAHTKYSHREASTCELCGDTFKNIEMHTKTMHKTDKEKRYKCSQCEKAFAVKNSLKLHEMNVHIKSRPYQCRYGCENRYNDSGNRSAHEKRRHGQAFKG